MAGLSRELGLTALILYGVGDILGAGIYALVGKVAGISGTSAWISFLVSAALAAVTGLTYAELASRIPRAAGAAAYCAEAFPRPLIGYLVGFFVLASGVTSTAAVSLAFHGYLKVFLDIPQLPAALALILFMSWISFRGIRESTGLNNVFTLIEVSGLLTVIAYGLAYAARQPEGALLARLEPSHGVLPILSGATLAFYAFIGFEDLANLAEEARDPQRDIPRAILAAVAISTAIYLTVICVVLWAMTPDEAAKSTTPLLDVLRIAGSGIPAKVFAPVALFAVCNTGLANLVMASRLLYGMAGQGVVPAPLAAIHPVRRTPHRAVLAAMGLCVALVLTGGVTVMAQTTSLLLILVFAALHAALIVLRRRNPSPAGVFHAPAFAPYAGIGVCLLMASQAPGKAYGRMLLVLGVALAFYRAADPLGRLYARTVEPKGT